MNNLAINNVLVSQSGVTLSGDVLTITADKLTAAVVLTHKSGTTTKLQWNGKGFKTIVVQFPPNGMARIPMIMIELDATVDRAFKEPRLTDQDGISPIVYPCITCNIVDPKTLSLAITAPEAPDATVQYSNVWFNTTTVPFDPTVIIKT